GRAGMFWQQLVRRGRSADPLRPLRHGGCVEPVAHGAGDGDRRYCSDGAATTGAAAHPKGARCMTHLSLSLGGTPSRISHGQPSTRARATQPEVSHALRGALYETRMDGRIIRGVRHTFPRRCACRVLMPLFLAMVGGCAADPGAPSAPKRVFGGVGMGRG